MIPGQEFNVHWVLNKEKVVSYSSRLTEEERSPGDIVKNLER